MTQEMRRILGRDEGERDHVSLTVARIGVTADGGARRVQFARFAEILTVQIEAGDSPDDVILAQAGDEVSITVRRRFGLLEVTRFANASLGAPDGE